MAHLEVKFHTQQERFKVTETPFSVLGSITATELNELINKLLNEQNSTDEVDETNEKVEFDFLVHEEFLRSNLLDHIHEKGLSVESVLPIEYLEKQKAPELESCLEHDDWVSGIYINEKYILTGSYDCAVNVWERKNNEKICSFIGHSEPVKAVSWIQHKDEKLCHFLSASQDQHVFLWQLDTDRGKLKTLFRCKGHSKSVECLAVREDNSMFVSGSWDCSIKLWSTSPVPQEGTAEEEDIKNLSGRKRQRVEKKGFPRTPKRTLAGHTEAVTGLVWLNAHEASSASWDHTIRLWDMEQGVETSQMRGTKAITSIDYSPLSHTLVTGNTDRHIRLWDPRSSDGALVKCSLTSHQGWVTCVKWSPTQPHALVSGSLDNLLKLWDIRSPKTPLYDLAAHEDKIMCLDWSLPQTIGSGGADNKAFTFSTASGRIERKVT